MSGQDMLYLRELLLHRRKEIFNRVRELESDWDSLAERDIELEEEAQKADLSSLFNLLDELGKEEIEEIDLALSKMASGNYGICESCQKQISLKRLKAFPEARLCSKCMRKYEEKQKKLQPASEVISSAEVPSEYRNLSGEELQMQIFDQLASTAGSILMNSKSGAERVQSTWRAFSRAKANIKFCCRS
ncbi:MAG: TraR/DksA C4-type zinc finger protein [Deltaproteobacteria bacterium]|nr:TraR/DksA C4-type zinc finger protein [Deltaproteobacteria bacterium]